MIKKDTFIYSRNQTETVSKSAYELLNIFKTCDIKWRVNEVRRGRCAVGTSPAALTQFEYCFFENMKLEALELWGEKGRLVFNYFK